MFNKLVLFLVGLGFCGCQSTQSSNAIIQAKSVAAAAGSTIFASAVLEARSGTAAHGVASFAHRGHDIEIIISVSNATPGLHGIHIHEIGDCSAEDASSAGGHFNPAHLKHGALDPQKFHMGDLGNIDVDQYGHGELKLTISAHELHADFHDWSVIVGKSIVLHQQPDDETSQPAGNSGARIACGVIMSPSVR